MITRTLIAATCCLIPNAAFAGDAQPWTTLQITAPVGKDWQLSGDVTERIVTDPVKPSQTVLRGQIGRSVNRKLIVWAGYSWTETNNKAARDGVENRAQVQFNWKAATIGPVRVVLRGRIEYRIIRGASADAWRARSQIKLAVPLGESGIDAVTSVEPFFALNRTSATRSGVEQLRGFVGVSFPVSKNADLEIGYLNQYFPRTGVSNNVVPMVLSVHF